MLKFIYIIIFIFILYQYKLNYRYFIGFKVNFENLKIVENKNYRDYECFNKTECITISERVKILKNIWETRKYGTFKTLGKAVYLNDHYEKNINKILINNFKHMYEIIANKLSKILQEPVYFKSDGFIPGFHIFERSFANNLPIMSIHLDQQQYFVNWKDQSLCDYNNPYTFTVCFEKPKSGAGIYIFDGRLESNAYDVTKRDKEYIEYKLGYLNIHDGLNWHMISHKNIREGEYRITLQGHLLKYDNKWLIYW